MCYQNDLTIISEYVTFCQCILGLSHKTGYAYSCDLSQLAYFTNFNRSKVLLDLNHHDLIDCLNDLIQQNKARRIVTIGRKVATYRKFFSWAVESNLIENNPAERLPVMRDQTRLPLALNSMYIEQILELFAVGPLELRNRLIVAMLYDTGLRVSELAAIQLHHLDLSTGCIRVVGKGKKERMVLFSKSTRDSIIDYIQNVRFNILKNPFSTPYLFVTYRGGGIHRNTILWIVKSMAKKAGVPEYLVSPHKFRHSFAVHMLDGGSHILAIKMLLGHECISSTEIYTRLTVSSLKKVHALHHPRGNF